MQADLVIIGGGPVGLCAALALQQADRQVVVLESGLRPERQAEEGLGARSIALSASSVQVFRAIGIWTQLKVHATPMRHVHVSTRGQFGVARLHADDVGVDALGYVVESYHLEQCLLKAIDASESIDVMFAATVNALQQFDDRLELDFEQNGESRRVTGKLGLVADGARSKLRDSLGIQAEQVDYGQSLIICNVEVSQPEAETAYERFTEQGPLAMLPLGGQRYACVWTMSPQQAEIRMDIDEDAFIAQLQSCFGLRLGYIERVGKRASMPLYRISSHRLTEGRCLLLGNAANALHPVAGQSYNLSIRDVAVLQALLASPFDWQDRQQLTRMMTAYSEQRMREQRRVIRYSDTLVSLFSNRLAPLRQGCGIGLAMLDLVNPLKTHLAFLGMGLAFGGNPMLRGKR